MEIAKDLRNITKKDAESKQKQKEFLSMRQLKIKLNELI